MQDQLTAGDTLNYQTWDAVYPPSAGWTGRLLLTPRAGGTNRSIDATAQDDAYLWQAGPAVTALWTPGPYSWAFLVLKAGERYTRQRGQLLVLADPAQLAAGSDTRSTAEVALANITALLQGRASDGVLRYKINGRELERYSMPELLKLESKLQDDVAAERRAQGLSEPRGTVRRILVRTR